DNNNQMPTYENANSQNILYSFTSDDYFVCLDANEGGEMNNGLQGIDVAVGRLPAANAAEAQGMVEKIKLYKSATSLASWRNVISVV
ncbi:C25 family cysteine peptidase, partial [Vibrio parahaemolyticus]